MYISSYLTEHTPVSIINTNGLQFFLVGITRNFKHPVSKCQSRHVTQHAVCIVTSGFRAIKLLEDLTQCVERWITLRSLHLIPFFIIYSCVL